MSILVKLIKLNLWKNRITSIDSNGFKHLDCLKDLDMGENQLTQIESNTFQHLIKLKKLELSSNQIKQIDSNGLEEKSGFRGNKFTR